MIRRFFSIFSPDASQRKLKTITYRGGVITFQVPSSWKAEYEPEGGGTFFEDKPGTGTLRLNIITAKAPEGKLPPDGLRRTLE